MRALLNIGLQRFWSRWGLGEMRVPVARCVHYGAFRYGRAEYQPYESYLVDLVRGGDRRAARDRLADFLRHYRPQNFGEAIGATLQQAQPLWQYPWNRRAAPPAWVTRLADCPDILTHFLVAGISRPRLEEEFGWLEQALASIQRHGYQPRKFRSSILARKLVRRDGAVAFLLLDGNHRVAALAALGNQEVEVCCPPWLVVRETELPAWPLVRAGAFSAEDARAVFHAYFDGNHRFRTTTEAAPLREDLP